MEVECGKRIAARSVDHFEFCYITFLSDRDSKAFDAVQEMKIYGEENIVKKEDYVNHVAKRIGTALRNLVQTSKDWWMIGTIYPCFGKWLIY